MPLLDFELVVLRTNGEKVILKNVPLIPRVGEEILLKKDSITPLKVLKITHDFGGRRVIISTD